MRAKLITILVSGAIALTYLAAREHAHADAPPIEGAVDDALPMQASCGDQRCSPPEDCNTCPRDCGSCCGDRRCAPPEDCNTCPQDCGGC